MLNQSAHKAGTRTAAVTSIIIEIPAKREMNPEYKAVHNDLQQSWLAQNGDGEGEGDGI
jgi:hypothetical protein